LKERADKASIKDDTKRLRWLHRHLGKLHLDEITPDILDRVIDAKQAEGVKNATVNRYLALIRAILRRAARKWRWLNAAPEIEMLAEPKGRVRWLARAEADRLARALPEHVAEPYRFALATGLRQRNVFNLQWDQCDLARKTVWVHADQSKNGKALGVPLSSEALAVLRRQRGKHPTHVFVWCGRPIRRFDSETWKRGLRRAELGPDVCWHVATRHTWASWHVMEGTPLYVLKELGGWSTLAMVQRYAHLAPEHLRAYADNASRPLVTIASQ
jgi:integrase